MERLTQCARCRQRPLAHPYLGCLCNECEGEIEGMTPAELDADYEAHQNPTTQGETRA